MYYSEICPIEIGKISYLRGKRVDKGTNLWFNTVQDLCKYFEEIEPYLQVCTIFVQHIGYTTRSL